MIPLSFAQQRLWFLNQFEGPSATYNIPLCLRLEGDLNIRALEQAFHDVLWRHESLRTHLVEGNGVGGQEILDGGAITATVEVIDLDEASLTERLAIASRYCFDVTRDLPIRLTLFRLGPTQHVLLVLLHHIASDGASLAPLTRDLTSAYEARCSGQPPGWSPLPIQYADFTLWQREWFGEEEDPDSTIATQIRFWKEELAGLPERIRLPFDHQPPARPSYRGDQVPVEITASTYRRLLALARECQATPFMVLHAAVATLLSRLGAGTDIPLGTAVANRTDEVLQDLIGYFANTLVLRTDTSGNPSFRELLARVRHSDLASYSNQDLPFERLVEIVNPIRSSSHQPLFQVLLLLQDNPGAEWRMPGMTVTRQPLKLDVAKFDLTFSFGEVQNPYSADSRLQGRIEFATDLFERSSIELLAARLQHLLQAVAVHPDQAIGHIDLLAPDERNRLLVEWNNTLQLQDEALLPEQFEAQVRHHPDTVAVVFEDQALTYNELNVRANCLAHALIDEGIGPENLVAIALPRSIDLVVALLAVLKSGAAYLPLDPDHPRERLAFMLDDARPARLITLASLGYALPQPENHWLLDEWSQRQESTQQSDYGLVDADRHHRLQPQHPAYVMYTSGSTGKPKGVVVPHSALVNFLCAMQRQPGLYPQDVALACTPISFDIAGLELYGPLLSGARLHITPPQVANDGHRLKQHISVVEPTLMQATPSSWQMLREAGWKPSSRMRILCGGEALTSSLADDLAIEAAAVWNMYGPTETTIWSLMGAINHAEQVCIGRPIDNTQVYVLDGNLQPVPVGVPGELYIGGSGLARGYLNRPGLTAERFVANPFGDPGSRLYRSGDRVRWQADGNLDFLGRVDHQLKLRGFRIEPGEIEACLLRHPAVAHAAVLAREDLPGQTRLVAYVVAAAAQPLDTAALRRTLAQQLPDYMVPAAIMALEHLPLTPNGKLDRNALPAPDFTPISSRVPRTPQEEVLAGLFAEVLGLKHVGIDDSFFDLGGHSLLATRLVSRVRSMLAVELPIRALFEAPTVAGLAEHLAQGSTARTALRPQPRPDHIPLSFAQQRLWFLHQFEGPSATYNVPLCLRLEGELRLDALQAALHDLLLRHESLRTRFAETDGVGHQIIVATEDAVPSNYIIDVTEVSLSAAINAAVIYRFDLSQELPLRASLFRLAGTRHVLLLLTHHIASDGASWAPFVRDLGIAYAARCQGQAPAWKPLPVQYADYTLWQRQWLGEESDSHSAIASQIAFWKQTLAGLPEQIELPTDRPRPASASHRGAHLRFPLSVEIHGELLRVARSNQASLFMVLHAAIAVLLSRMGCGTDIPIGTAIANRTDDALQDLVGYFANTLVLRTNTAGNPSLRELLARVRNADLAAYAHQDLPFEHLVELLNPVRSNARHPLFQVAVVLQNYAEVSPELSGLTIVPQPLGFNVAKFDLTFTFFERFDSNGAPAGGRCNIAFATDLFDRSTIEALARRLQRLLEAIAANPDQAIGQIDLLDADERQQILIDWNDTARPLPDTTLAASFEQQVRRSPDAVAVVCEASSLSYAELNARANQLAHHLQGLGVGPDVLVGLCLERSPEFLIAMLAILKAGAAYLPLDPQYPAERLAQLLNDTMAPVLVTHSAFVDCLPAHWAQLVELDTDAEAIARQPLTAPTGFASPLQLAYVMYTSGSTGLPKGIGISQRSVVELALDRRWQAEQPPRVLLHSPQVFDASTYEIWVPLLNGGQVVIAPPGDKVDPQALARVITRFQVRDLWLTAALFQLMVNEDVACFRGVGRVIAGGEALSAVAVQRLLDTHPAIEVANGYGPTECTTFATNHPMRPPCSVGASVPIGAPMDNTRVYVLDGNLQPVPVGVPGELYIGGSGLARGYLNRPALTAERFIADPFGDPGSRLYRSGDRVRWQADGTLDYLGRIDQQVKLRGFRIEPAEIEACLLRQPAVAQAAVVVREDQPGNPQLVGYVVRRAARQSSRDEQRETEHVREWQALYEQLYGGSSDAARQEDFTGWDNSYDGQAIELEQMREWRAATLTRIQSLNPQRVLEIGVGSGLMLWRLASDCESYWGTDFSSHTIAALQRRMEDDAGLRHKVQLRTRPAHDMEGLPAQFFDTIILNSVVQYFPSVDYLVQVLRQAMDHLVPGGRIFLGDVRNHRLLRCFATAVALSRRQLTAAPDAALQRVIEQDILLEKELLLDPEFFIALQDELPVIAGVDIQLKHGAAHNELTRHRYEVVLHKRGAQLQAVDQASTLTWGPALATLAELEQQLSRQKWPELRISGIPNQRLAGEFEALHRIWNSAAIHARGPAVDPQDCLLLGKRLGYHVALTWSAADDGSAFDAIFIDPQHLGQAQPSALYRAARRKTALLQDYANHPDALKDVRALSTELRRALAAQLPEYLLPAAIIVLDQLPLTPNGKLDHHALPAPDFTPTSSRAPRTPQEEILADLFAEVLGLERVGIDDSFFDLGGHSLLATRLVSRIRSLLEVEAPIRLLFDKPTVAGLAAALASAATARVPLRPQPRPAAIPLSFAQQRLWFLHQFEGPSTTYNTRFVQKLQGSLDIAALQHALRDVVVRHESLCTIFTEIDGVGRQSVLPPEDVPPFFEVIETDNASLLDAMTLAAGYCFELAREIPIRATVFRASSTEHVLLLLIHHIASDGGSWPPLVKDLGMAYAARCQGQAPAWKPLPVQYVDYTLWQRQWLGEESDSHSAIASQIAFWKQTLAGLPEQIELPTDRPRPRSASYRGDHLRFELSAEVHGQLLQLAHGSQASLFMVLHAAVVALLSRMGAGTDIAVGSPIAGRTDDALASLIGFFVNTLVLRADTSGNPTFRDLLGRVRSTDLAAYTHQDLPFERLVELLNPVRSNARHPLFQVMLVLQNNATARLQLPGLTVVPQAVGFDVAKFDLTFSFAERRNAQAQPAGLYGIIEYATDLFDRATVESFARRLQRLLEVIVDHPDQAIGQIELLDTAERQQILLDWNDTARPLPDTTLPALFEEQVRRSPDAVAVVCEASSLSYAELNARANRLAHALIADGIGPEDRVAIALPRSIDLVVAVLGILKAGAAYLPLDPDYPSERLAFMLDDAGPARIITSSALAPTLPKTPAQWLIDQPDPLVARHPTCNPTDADRCRPLLPQHPAYVIYTSGSTGKPKGVVIQHASLVTSTRARLRYYDCPGSMVLLPSAAFDSSVATLFWSLCSGASLLLPPPRIEREPAQLAHLLEQHQVHTWLSVPSLFDTALDLAPDGLASLHTVVLAGEAWMAGLIRKGRERLPLLKGLFNEYGPTEATVWTSVAGVEQEPATIGRPIDNTQVYVLDGNLQPVPVGVPGELYIGGSGLARGYLNRPGLTAERFVANPFGDPGSRLYRSGDRVRWQADGNLDFLGRVDHQLKLRGFRIEPGEIEACLLRHPAVAHAAVLAREDLPGQTRLVAYVVAAAAQPLDTAALRRTLAQQLPDYMVPAAIMALEHLPLTPNGKLDRNALPAPDFTPISSRVPRTLQEEVLAGLFAEVLGLKHVGIDDSFFDLGGHSLLATRLVSRVRSMLAVELPIRALFEAPTVAGLAEHLAQGSTARTALRPQPRPDHIPLSFAQQRLWFLHQFEGPSATYNVPLCLRLEGELRLDALQAALHDLLLRHESLRTMYGTDKGIGYQKILTADALPALIQVVEATEASLPALLLDGSRYGFDILHEIPLRATLFRISSTEQVLLLLIHHIASDAGSWAPLVKDLGMAYAARCQGQAPAWKPLPVQYADYTLWQRQWLGEESDSHSAIASQIAFWKQTLAGLPEQIELPTDRPRPASASHRGAHLPFALSAEVHGQLLQLAHGSQASLFMVLHAAVAALLSRMGAGADIPIGTSIAGRTDEALDVLVGFFVNLLVLRADTSGNPTFRDLLGRVRSTDLAAYTHQDLPFERLVELLNPVRSNARHPLFQVALVLNNNARANIELQGLKVRPQSLGFDVAKYDLAFGVGEQRAADGTPRGIAGSVEYATDLFDRSTIEALARRLQRLLEAIAANPDQAIGQIDLLDADERQQILIDWNDTARPLPDTTLAASFEQQVRRSPDAVAVVCEASSLSYAELNARANQLAHHLQGLGVGPDVLVGLCLERSPEFLIAMLAILKAGAAYLPLDPQYPAERLAQLLNDTMAPVLVTHSAFVDCLPAHWAQLVELDTDAEAIARQPLTAPTGFASPLQLAYVMYTSGSTGLPKGIGISQRSVVELALDRRWQAEQPPRVLLHSPQVFDASTYEIWVPLLNGGQVVIAPPGRIDIPMFASLIGNSGITSLFLTTALFRLLAEEQPQCFASVRAVWTGGETASVPAFRKVVEHCPQTRLVHVYGPTESTTFATCRVLNVADCNGGSAPIGAPIDNTQVYVLDGNLQPVPVGVPGELYIGGSGLARGYLNRPGLTAERFVANPFGDPGSRLYRSGDRVRWQADGNLDFLGRVDHQLKLRGFRIEPGEIEACLLRHPAVAHAAVLAREDLPGQTRLVAYVVAAAAQPLDTAALRRTLAQQLPDYMVPAAIMALEHLPLTPNGKLDRNALPAPDFTPISSRVPRTPQEEVLAGLFAEVLGLKHVGIDDSFFDLGGDSLLSLQLKALAQALGIDFDLSDLFSHQTVATLASVIRASDIEETSCCTECFSLVPEADRNDLPPDIEDAYPLSHLQLGMFYHNDFEATSTLYHVIMSTWVDMPWSESALRATFDALCHRHPMLRTSFDLSRYSTPLQLVHTTVEIPLTIFDWRAIAENDQTDMLTDWSRAEQRRPFDKNAHPLLQASVHRKSDDRFGITLSFHHAIMDGWSDASLVTEMMQLYGSKLKRIATEKLPLSSCYRDYIALERTALASEQSRSFWQRFLEGHATAELLHVEAPSTPASDTTLDIQLPILLADRDSDAIQSLARRLHAPVKSVLLTAHLAALSVMTGSRDVMTAIVTNGRPERRDGDKIIGLFLNSVPFCLKLACEPWSQIVDRVMRIEQEVFRHRRYPLPQIRKEAGLQRPIDVLFNYTHFHIYEQLGEARKSLSTDISGGDSSFGLRTNFWLEGNRLFGQIAGHRSLYSRATLERYAGCYTLILRHMAFNVEQMFAGCDLLDEGERQNVLITWNDTESAVPEAPLPALFEQQVQRSPDGIAVIFDEQAVSYSRLNAASNHIAQSLLKLGLTPESRVAVWLDRSPAMIASLIGILKAGHVYVPLHDALPPARIGEIMRQSASTVLLIDRDLIQCEVPSGVHILRLPEDLLRRGEAENPSSHGTAHSLAYVMYTSGSTGLPKGVAVNHAAVATLALDRRWQDGSQKRVLFHSPIAFDASTYEIWVPLLNGGQVVIAPPGRIDIPMFASLIGNSGITSLFLTTALFRLLAEEQPQCFASVRAVWTGGETASVPAFRKVVEHCPQTRLVHVYGPTESTTFATCRVLNVADCNGGSAPIGAPIDNTQVYVLDGNLQPVPVGVPGELYIGGSGLARGYLNRPGLTAERFVANPFGDPGSRLYRSGDRVRWQADGNLDFLGRVDHQLKLRGFRIEPGEIEACLLRHPAVAHAAVLAREDLPGQTRLVAYVVAAAAQPLDTAALRRTLAQQLPDYMVPAAIMALEHLPLTPNGKLDRNALPAPDFTPISSRVPRTPQEEVLAGLFAEVLGLKHVGIDDSFFDLGGDSLLVTRLASRISASLNIELPIRALYDSPTVTALANRLFSADAAAPSTVLPLRKSGRHPPLFCLPPAGNMPWCYAGLLRHIDADCPVYGLQAPDFGSDPSHSVTVDRDVEHYLADILRIQSKGPYRLLGWSIGGLVAHALAARLQSLGHEVGLLAVLDAYPGVTRHRSSSYEADSTLRIVTALSMTMEALGVSPETIPRAGASLADSIDELIANGAIAREDRQMMLRMASSFMRGIRLAHTYSPQHFEGAMVFFRATIQEAGAPIESADDWQTHVTGGLEVHDIPARHSGMLDREHRSIIGEVLARHLLGSIPIADKKF